MIRIRVFRAVDDQEACEKFIEGHRRILEIYYGIIKITSDNTEWINDPHTIVIIAEDTETKNIYGGAKLQIATGKYQLPIETAISKYDKNIYEIVKYDRHNGGTGEICALWNSKEVAGMGIGSHILVRVAIAISDQLNIKSIYSLCAPSTVRIAMKKGFRIIRNIGNEGTFFYPKDDFIATAMKLNDIYDFSPLDSNEAQKIKFLRENITQVIKEKGPKGEFEVDYNLKVLNWQ